jgi:hypothetical protein
MNNYIKKVYFRLRKEGYTKEEAKEKAVYIYEKKQGGFLK